MLRPEEEWRAWALILSLILGSSGRILSFLGLSVPIYPVGLSWALNYCR